MTCGECGVDDGCGFKVAGSGFRVGGLALFADS